MFYYKNITINNNLGEDKKYFNKRTIVLGFTLTIVNLIRKPL